MTLSTLPSRRSAPFAALVCLVGWAATAPPARAQDESLRPTFALDVAVKAGWPTSFIESVKLVRVGVELPFRLRTGERWRVEAPVSVYPVTYARNVIGSRLEHPRSPRTASIGITVHPLAVRLVRSLGSSTGAHVALTGGGVYFDRPVPTRDATRLNYSADLEAGLRFATPSGYRISVAYVYNHISNGGDGNENLALDSHMVRVAVGGG